MNRKDKTPNEGRRDFLKKAGRFAVYTPPALMVMMKPSHAQFLKTGGVTPRPPTDYFPE